MSSAAAHSSAAVTDIPEPRRKPRPRKKKTEALAQPSGNNNSTDNNNRPAAPTSGGRPRPSPKKSQAKGSETHHAPNQQNGTRKKKGKTPYQGSRKTFGFFECPTCEKTWASAHSWANMGQECSDCRVNVYPYAQKPLQRGKSKKAQKRHLEEFCEKCKSLSGSCTKYGYDSKREE